MTKPRTPEEQYAHDFNRLSKFVTVGGPFDNCYNFTGSIRNLYGQIRDGKSVIQAHRFAYKTIAGLDLPANLDLDHRCHNTICVRPSHMRKVERAQHCKDTWRDARLKKEAEEASGEEMAWNAGNPKPLSIKELEFGLINGLPVNLFGCMPTNINIEH